MRICLVGDFSGVPDEAMRIVSRRFAEELEQRHQLLRLDIKSVFRLSFWSAMRRFRPEVIHYVPGPGPSSLLFMKIAGRWCRDARTVVSAMHPSFSAFEARFIKRLRPDLVLVQSAASEQAFKALGCNTGFLPSGVDSAVFQPVSPETKAALRRKYALPRERFILLHVGAIRMGRGVQVLRRLQGPQTQVVILAAASSGINRQLMAELRKAGCMVLTSYAECVAELYALADCYIFPTAPVAGPLAGGALYSIEMPLSVLEAMSCNLPVITTRFGALPRVFGEGRGLFYASDEFDFARGLQQIRGGVRVDTRQLVLPYSWPAVVARLETFYTGLRAGDEAQG